VKFHSCHLGFIYILISSDTLGLKEVYKVMYFLGFIYILISSDTLGLKEVYKVMYFLKADHYDLTGYYLIYL
jgi:hypothetical protein